MASPTEPEVAPAPAAGPVDLHERIRRRAYELWESEGRPTDRDREHWEQAERELTDAAQGSTGPSAPFAGRGGGAAASPSEPPPEEGDRTAPSADPGGEPAGSPGAGGRRRRRTTGGTT